MTELYSIVTKEERIILMHNYAVTITHFTVQNDYKLCAFRRNHHTVSHGTVYTARSEQATVLRRQLMLCVASILFLIKNGPVVSITHARFERTVERTDNWICGDGIQNMSFGFDGQRQETYGTEQWLRWQW